jgi:hypothetical protein
MFSPLQTSKRQHVVICQQYIEVAMMYSNSVDALTDGRIDYYNEGAMDLITYVCDQDITRFLTNLGIYSLKDNEAAFNRYKIRPRVLVNVAKIDLETEIFGVKVSTYISEDRSEQY